MKTQIVKRLNSFTIIREDEVGSITDTQHALKDQILSSMEARSITPTTFVVREFENGLNDQYHTEQYNFNSNQIIRFGINNLAPGVLSALQIEGVRLEDDHNEPTTRSSSKYTLGEATQISLCELERALLIKAIDYLLESESHKTALIDIFVRVNGGAKNGAIKINNNIPQIHTVVLYKNPITGVGESKDEGFIKARDISVIDPSNFLFSSHLSNFTHTDIKIHTVHKPLKIYQPITRDIGPNPHQYRDCIDIATKIASGLAETYLGNLLTITEIETCPVLRNLSNNPNVDTNIIHPVAPTRIKQISDLTIVDLFCDTEAIIKFNYKLIKSGILSTDDFDQLEEKALQTLSDNTYEHRTKIQKLLEHNQECSKLICSFVSNNQMKIMDLFDELYLE